jgi:hypothetical protein
VDFEDVAISPGPTADKDYIYVGDIGDNESRRPQVRVYRTVEPGIVPAKRPEFLRAAMEDFRFVYPQGPCDAEALLVEPESGDIYIATKEKKRARIFRAAADQLKPGQTVTLEHVATLKQDKVSGGDVSRDGKWVVLRNEKTGWLWPRRPGESLADTLATTEPREISVRDKSQAKNGEAITFDPAGNSYFTISEGVNQPLARFPLKASE